MRLRHALLALLGFFLAACQSYKAKPIEVSRIAEEIRARNIDETVLLETAARLEGRESLAFIRPVIHLEDGYSLDESFLVGLAYSPRLKSIRETLGEKNGMLVEASALPAVEWMGEAVDNDGLEGASNLKADLLSLFDVLRRPARRDLAKAEYAMAKWLVMDAEWRLYASLHSLFIRARHHWHLEQAITEKIRQYSQDVLSPGLKLKNAGRLPSPDYDSLEEVKARMEKEIASVQNIRLIMEEEICDLMGLPHHWPLKIQYDDEPELPHKDPSSAQLLGDLAFNHRLDIQIALAEYLVAEQILRVEISKQYPEVQLGPRVMFGGMGEFFGMNSSVMLPLFYQNQGAIKTAEARREKVRWQVEGRLLDIMHEIDISLHWVDYYDRQIARMEEDILPKIQSMIKASAAKQAFDPMEITKRGKLEMDYFEGWMETQMFEMDRLEKSGDLVTQIGLPLNRIIEELK